MGADNLLWLKHAGHTMSVRINGARRFSPGSGRQARLRYVAGVDLRCRERTSAFRNRRKCGRSRTSSALFVKSAIRPSKFGCGPAGAGVPKRSPIGIMLTTSLPTNGFNLDLSGLVARSPQPRAMSRHPSRCRAMCTRHFMPPSSFPIHISAATRRSFSGWRTATGCIERNCHCPGAERRLVFSISTISIPWLPSSSTARRAARRITAFGAIDLTSAAS